MNVNGLLDGDQHVQGKQVNTTSNDYPPSPPLTAHGSASEVAQQPQKEQQQAEPELVQSTQSYPSPPLTHEGASTGSPSQPEVAYHQPSSITAAAPPTRDESTAVLPPDSPRQPISLPPAEAEPSSAQPEAAASVSSAAPQVESAPAQDTTMQEDAPAVVASSVPAPPQPAIPASATIEPMPPAPEAALDSAPLSSGQKRSAEPEEDRDAPNKRIKSSTPPAPEAQPMVVDQPGETPAPVLPQSEDSVNAVPAPSAAPASDPPSADSAPANQMHDPAAPTAPSTDMDADAPGSADLPPEPSPVHPFQSQASSEPAPQADTSISEAQVTSYPSPGEPQPDLTSQASAPMEEEPVHHAEPSHMGDTTASQSHSQPQPSVDTAPFEPSFSSTSSAPPPPPAMQASEAPEASVSYSQPSFAAESQSPSHDAPYSATTPSFTSEPPPPAFDQQQSVQTASMSNSETPFSQAAAAMQRGETLEFAPKPDTSWVKAEHPLSGIQFKFAQKLVKDLLKHKASGPFHMPVDPYSLNLPTYWSVIKRPIDFGSVNTKLNNGAYATLDDFAADVRRVFSNCYHFNGEAAPVSLMAKQVEPMFEAKIQKAPTANGPVTANKQRKNSMPPLNSSTSRQGPAVERPKREVQPPTPYEAFDDSLYHQPPAQQKKKTKAPAANMLPEELKFCKEVIRELFKKAYQPFAWPFLQPVDWQGLGLKDYPEIVPRPMDLGTMKQKLETGQYYDAESFHRDFNLCISNCVKYNGSESDVGKMASQLDSVFNSKWAEKPDLSDDDNSDDGEIRMMEQQLEMMRENLDRMKENKARKRAERLAAKSAAKAAERAAQQAAIRKAKPPPAPRPPPKQPRRPSPEMDVAFEEEPDDDFDFDAELADTGAPEKPSGRGARRKSHKKRRDSDEDDDFLGASVGGNRAADDHSRNEEITFEMKQELANGIGALENDKLDRAIDIIRKSRPDLLGDESKEIELDIDSLDNSTLYKLYTFVVRGGNKNKPKRQETLTARGHRAQKGGRAGTGGLKGKSLDEAAESAKIAALEAQLAQFTAENGGNPDASGSLGADAGGDEDESESEEEGGGSSDSE